eukprot:3642428-Prorocentrum_lima.AAC.1
MFAICPEYPTASSTSPRYLSQVFDEAIRIPLFPRAAQTSAFWITIVAKISNTQASSSMTPKSACHTYNTRPFPMLPPVSPE